MVIVLRECVILLVFWLIDQKQACGLSPILPAREVVVNPAGQHLRR
jgi:hypothetical protein